MYNYFIWPGACSLRQEISLLWEYIKEQIDLLILKIENAENKFYM